MAAQPRHIPLRSCVVCRAKLPKRDLVRVVMTPGGDCIVDETGKHDGRGAYVCRQEACWQAVAKSGRLARALRETVSDASRARLQEYGAALPSERRRA